MSGRDRQTDDDFFYDDGDFYDDGYETLSGSRGEFRDTGDPADFYDDDPPRTDGAAQDRRRRRQRQQRRRQKSLILQYALIVILAVIVVVCIYQVGSQLLEYRQASQEYEELSSLFEPIPETETQEDTDGETQEEAVSLYPALSIDYDALREINDEFVCIIHIPVLDLTYPVAQADNNTDYLTKTFEGTTNSSGCIYLDALSSPDFVDWNTYIFGHNMKNQTMFGSLKLFLQDEDLCNSDPYIYIYQEDQILVYRIFAYYTIPVDDDVYKDFYDEDGYDDYVADAFVNSEYATYENDEEIDWSARPNLLTLSTCYGTDHTYNFIVQGALIRTVYPEEEEEAA